MIGAGNETRTATPDLGKVAPTELFLCNRMSSASDWRAGTRLRTPDPDLGKVVLYQLSYSPSPEYHLHIFGASNETSSCARYPGTLASTEHALPTR